jgi:hypothetical protein
MRARRIVLWAAVMGVAAAAVMLAGPLRGGLVTRVEAASVNTQSTGGIDLSAAVTPSSCAHCHQRIAEAKKPGIIFNHATHLPFQCAACHLGNAHMGGKTASPPMKLCFNCHGLSHGAQGELATKTCSQCHTKGFQLRPKTHTKDWAAKPHATAANKSGVNDCLLCHDRAKDCDACHAQKGVKMDPVPATYQPVYSVPPRPPTVKIYPEKTTTMSQCVQCHPNLDAFKPGVVIFQHQVHLKNSYRCEACHPKFVHQGEKIERPSMQSCYRCHGLNHSGQGQVATGECAKCHPPTFPLKPKDHTVSFAQKDHGAQAGKDAAYCAMCHQLSFCTDCHLGKKAPSWLQAGQKVVPQNHKVTTWAGAHGKLFLQGKGMCASCHDGQSCMVCHKTPMPHPTGWLNSHRPQDNGVPKTDCYICHTNRDACQQCHHDKVKNAELIAKNCVRCHEEMKQKPATAIKNKAFSEHAVHFDVAKKKGAPYKCDDCHVDFGTSQAAQAAEKTQGHDLRLCYSCHGALDYQNRLIAPWPGAALCRRCHTNLNI